MFDHYLSILVYLDFQERGESVNVDDLWWWLVSYWRCVRHRDIGWFYCNLEKTTQLRVAFRRVKLVTPRNHGWTVSPSVSGWYRVVPAYTDTPTKQWKNGPVVDIHPLEKGIFFLLLCSLEGYLLEETLPNCAFFGKKTVSLLYSWKLQITLKSTMICFQTATTTATVTPGTPRNQTRTSGWSFVGLQRGWIAGVDGCNKFVKFLGFQIWKDFEYLHGSNISRFFVQKLE